MTHAEIVDIIWNMAFAAALLMMIYAFFVRKG